MERWKAEIVFTQDPDGPWVVAANAQAMHAARLAADMKIRELLRELEGSRSSERMSAAKHEAVLAQAKAAEARVKELERDIDFLSQAGECFEVTLLAARAAGDSTKNLSEWLSGRLELLTKLEPGERRACVREEVVDVAHRHGWLGGIPLLDWLDRKLRERNDYQIRLNKLRDVLGQES